MAGSEAPLLCLLGNHRMSESGAVSVRRHTEAHAVDVPLPYGVRPNRGVAGSSKLAALRLCHFRTAAPGAHRGTFAPQVVTSSDANCLSARKPPSAAVWKVAWNMLLTARD